jgi:hypothetical protein
MFQNGEGTSKDFKQAENWLTRAAKRNDSLAQFYIGRLYLKEFKASKNQEIGMAWMIKSAENSCPMAQNYMGLLYYSKEDFDVALSWFQKAAHLNSAESQYYLAKFYFEGKGITQDFNKAEEWAKLSYNNGFDQAKEILDKVK